MLPANRGQLNVPRDLAKVAAMQGSTNEDASEGENGATGADFEYKGKFGQTPLSSATKEGHETIVSPLLDKGVNFKSKDDGRTPLGWATAIGNEAIVRLLLEKGADFESIERWGFTPLGSFAMTGPQAIIKLLLEKNIDFETKDGCGRTPVL
ncbi:Uncharacterized protein TPAR_01245 [Tolypocladium paradoxum]|uniref:Uncharacterized protein n=1 Tax=Tolypocladium paradoxum TaxID=94208 RepID=A0A2S4L7X3_9HYPO|nr:Uncharacterized protein TPAR_01245 [Tolypocladium paradoxum]